MLNNQYNSDAANKFLDYLMALSYNKKCADCGKQNPSWTDLTHAFFICYECSALHRRLGMHRSRVKSTQLDSWSEDDLRRMHVGGNKYAHRVPQHSDFMVKYKDTSEFVSFLDEKEEASRSVEPDESFMTLSRPVSVKNDEPVVVERKTKPKFSDFIDSSEDEVMETHSKRPDLPVPVSREEIEEEEEKLVFMKPGTKLKKSVSPSRSPFSFSVKEHEEAESSES